MKPRPFIFCILFCSLPALCNSQTFNTGYYIHEKTDTAALIRNTLSDNARDNMYNIFGAGYKYGIFSSPDFRYHISGAFYYRENPLVEIHEFNLAVYPKPSYHGLKKPDGNNDLPDFSQIYFNSSLKHYSQESYYYIAPGLSFFSKNRKFSLDLYHKLSTPVIIDGVQPIMPYKVNFHF